MKHNTRFNPTISGPLHIGHLYMVLVNAAEAHRTGGKFTIRIDDTQPYWNHWIKEDQRNKYYEDYQKQLNQFVEVDVWERQSQMLIPEEIIGEHPLLKKYSRFVWMETSNIEWRTAINQKILPYCPNHTLEKVVWDFWEDVNLLIRGDDLITESSLYAHFLDELGLPRIHQIYLSRLVAQDQQDKIIGTVSKTDRVYSLETQMKEFGIEGTLQYMRDSCLVDVKGEFLVDNIKPIPIAQGFKE